MLDRHLAPPIREPEQLGVPLPEVRVMPNGIPVYILNAGENEVVRIDMLLKGGRWQQTQRLQALFTNRMLREGTHRYTAAVIAEKLDYYGAWLELSSSSEHAYITLYSLNKYLPETLDVLESMVKEPLFPEKELKVIVDTNIQQFQVNSSKVDFLAHRELMRAIYGAQHPCGQLAEVEDYEQVTPELLRDFYNKHYHSGNCRIYLSGKVTEACYRQVEELFGNDFFGKTGHKEEKKLYIPHTTSEKRIFVERPDALQSAVRLGVLSIPRRHADYLKLRVAITLFGGFFGSRLMANIREDKGYTYGISAGLMPYPDSSLLAITTETGNEHVEPLIQEVYREIDRLQNELVAEEELFIVKNYMLGDWCRSYESAFSLADAWISIHTSGLSDTYPADIIKAVKAITPTEISELARRYLCKETLKEIVSGKKML